MNRDEVQQAKLTGELSRKTSTGVVVIRFYNQKVRLRRAIKVGGLLFALAIFSIALPILHFFLVPGFLLATPIGAFLAYGVESRLVEAKAKCPECQVDFQVAVGKPEFPYRDICASCHRPVIIEVS